MITGKDFVNTRFIPAYQAALQNEARRARAYFMGCPYPSFGFRDWKTEENGPIPIDLRLPRNITQQSARWLFGKPISFVVNGGQEDADKKAGQRLERIWADSKMHSRAKSAAEYAGQTGGYILKFSYEKDRIANGLDPICIDVFDASAHSRIYTDPLDINTVLMVRLEYPYFNSLDGLWYMHREEWTDSLHVEYVPQPITANPDDRLDMMGAVTRFEAMPEASSWKVASEKKNLFGVIPCQLVKNLDIGAEYGWGDLWSLWPLIDRINLTSDLMNKGNQLTAYPKEVRVNATTPADDDGAPLMPGEPEYLNPRNTDLPVDVKLLESNPAGRTHLKTYMDDLRAILYNTAGGVFLDAATVTGHGAMSRVALELLFQPLIELTNDKRMSQGECGISPFLQTLCTGLYNIGAKDDAAMLNPDVMILWPDYFTPSEEEQLTRAQRLVLEVGNGLKSQETAVTENLASDGQIDPAVELEKIKDSPSEKENEPNETNRTGTRDKETGEPRDDNEEDPKRPEGMA